MILCGLALILLGTLCYTPPAEPAVSAGALVDGMIYYVAPTGNDDNPGSVDYPWRTIQKAADTLTAGDTTMSLTVEGYEYPFIVHAPPS